MIRYYSYYSEGGYKDMFLGNNAMIDIEKLYYLPLLANKRAEADKKNDQVLLDEVEAMEALPKIGIIDSNNSYGLPYKASRFFTFGCYSMLYSHLSENKYIMIIRDIIGDSHDDGGKPVPFLMALLCDEVSDIRLMDRLFAFAIQNPTTIKKSLGGMIHYDANYNGLCFELGEMNKWLNSTLESKKDSGVRLTGGGYDSINGLGLETSRVMVTRGVDPNNAIADLCLDPDKTKTYTYYQVIPEDNQDVVNHYHDLWLAEQERLRREKLKKYGIIATAVVVVLIILIVSLSGD